MNDQALASAADQVRKNVGCADCFSSDWSSRYSGAWSAAEWAGKDGAYGAATWSDYSGYCGSYSGGYSSGYSDGYSSGYSDGSGSSGSDSYQPVYYDYGSNVVYQADNVYVNGDRVATQQQYAEEATAIADAGKQAEANKEEEWLALGVFAMTQGEQVAGNNLFQLAVNKAGVIRGNYYNELSDTTLPVYGSVDKSTQRAAWTIGDRKEPVFEAGIANLTRSDTTMLVHFGKGRTQQWILVRIGPPAEKN